MDIASRREIHGLLRKSAEQGTALLFSSSDNEELLEIADRILVFYEGRIVLELHGDGLTAERLAASMLGVAAGGGN